MFQADPHAALVWRFEATGDLTAASPDVFTLMDYSIDGTPQRITQSPREGGQTFTVAPTAEAAAGPHAIAYTLRALVPQAGHLLELNFDQPTRGVQVDFDYRDSGIHRVNLIPQLGSQQARVRHNTPDTPAFSSISYDDWIWPGSGLVYIWTLASEL